MHFSSINLDEGIARGIGHNGALDLTVTLLLSGLVFVEKVRYGAVFTTIFPIYKKGSSDEFVAIHSRHKIGGNGEPIPSYYMVPVRYGMPIKT